MARLGTYIISPIDLASRTANLLKNDCACVCVCVCLYILLVAIINDGKLSEHCVVAGTYSPCVEVRVFVV